MANILQPTYQMNFLERKCLNFVWAKYLYGISNVPFKILHQISYLRNVWAFWNGTLRHDSKQIFNSLQSSLAVLDSHKKHYFCNDNSYTDIMTPLSWTIVHHDPPSRGILTQNMVLNTGHYQNHMFCHMLADKACQNVKTISCLSILDLPNIWGCMILMAWVFHVNIFLFGESCFENDINWWWKMLCIPIIIDWRRTPSSPEI